MKQAIIAILGLLVTLTTTAQDTTYLNSFYSLKPRLRSIDTETAINIRSQADSLAPGYYLINSQGVYILKMNDEKNFLITLSSRNESIDSAYIAVTQDMRPLLVMYASYRGGITFENGYNKEISRSLRVIDMEKDWVLLDQNLHYHWQKKDSKTQKVDSEYMELDFVANGPKVVFSGVRFEPNEPFEKDVSRVTQWSLPPTGTYVIAKDRYILKD